MGKIIEKYKWVIVSFVAIFFLTVSILGAKNDSATFDEIAHIPAGYSYLTKHEMRLNPEHPPLLKDLSAIPLFFSNLNFDTTKDFWTKDNVSDNQWNAGRYLLYGAGNDADKIVFYSRIPLIFISLLLGFFIFKWTNEISTASAGIFALILFAFDPNILGHNHLVTTDLGIATFITMAFYYFLKFIKNPSEKNIYLSGLFLGLMQLAKFSAVITFPIFFLLVIIYPLVKENITEKSRIKILGEYIFKGFLVFVISLFVVWIIYFFNTYNMPKEVMNEGISYYFQSSDPNIKTIYSRKILFAINEHQVLRPLGEYLFGIVRVFQRVSGGNTTYFMHQVSNEASLSYFPFVYLVKEPLPTLFLILLALIISLKNIATTTISRPFKKSFEFFTTFIRTRTAEFAMISFVILYSYTSITGNLNIGLRHLFPIFPFIFILVSKSIFDFKRKHPDKKVFILVAISILSFWLIVETLIAYPYYISYFNQTVGGPKNGYSFVTDSNADWGQDIYRLKSYLDKHPEIDKIRVDYFGGGDIKYSLDSSRVISWWDSKRPLENGWYAISVNYSQGSTYDTKKSDDESYRWLSNYKPVAQVGTSIFIYHIEDIK